MKKLILSLLAVSLFVSVPMNAQVSKMRAIKCAIPYLHQRFQCTPAEIQMGKKWLTGASVALVVAVLAALGLSAQQARKAKRQAEQELSSTQAKMAEQQADLVEKNVLQAGKEIAQLRSKSPHDPYADITGIIQDNIATFNAATLRKRLGFLYAVTTGLTLEVKQTICRVGQDTIEEAKIEISTKAGQAFEEIRRLLNNPPCE